MPVLLAQTILVSSPVTIRCYPNTYPFKIVPSQPVKDSTLQANPWRRGVCNFNACPSDFESYKM